jgi:uncharacterized membrane protein
MTREHLASISKHSNIDADNINKLLKKYVLPGHSSWMNFIRMSMLVLGVGFLTTGIIFFFAFNWFAIHKFVKLGIIEGLVVLGTIVWFIKKLPEVVRKISLTSSAILVGVLFAVFGQIYQTDAIAFDWLRNWSLAITPMVIAGGFAPLTLLWVILLNGTVGTYLNQICNIQDEPTVLLNMAFINLIILLMPSLMEKWNRPLLTPKWFSSVIMSTILIMLTIGLVQGMLEPTKWTFIILCLLTISTYTALIYKAYNDKTIIPLVMVTLSAMIVASSIILEINNDTYAALLVSIFIIAASTLASRYLIELKKAWSDVTK